VNALEYNSIFDNVIEKYHIINKVDQMFENPYPNDILEHLLYRLSWIETLIWHFEEIARIQDINPIEALDLKQKTDIFSFERTNILTLIDSIFFNKYNNITVEKDATINTESLAQAIGRLSVLALKIYHMHKENERETRNAEQKTLYNLNLQVLWEQRDDLSTSIDELISDISEGKKYIKVYKPMKVFNELNP